MLSLQKNATKLPQSITFLLVILFLIVNLHPCALDELLERFSPKQAIISLKHAECNVGVGVMFEYKLAKKLIVVRAVLVNLGARRRDLFRLNNIADYIVSNRQRASPTC